MADFTALKNSIRNYIKQNGNAEITGEVLQNILISMVVSMGDGAINGIADGLANEGNARTNADGLLQNAINSISTALGDGYTYAGIATPATTPTSGRVFYLALQAGTYTNFGGIVVTQGINILKNNDGTWQLDNVIGIDDIPTAGSPNLVKSGGAFANMGAFDISDYNKSGSTLATYADLTAALAALPSEYQKGGMSVKFIQSSDNNYIQYLYLGTDVTGNPNPFLDTANWQKIGESSPLMLLPFIGNNNVFVKSGKCYNFIKGHKYRVYVNKDVDMTGVTVTGSYARFEIDLMSAQDTLVRRLVEVQVQTTLQDYYDIQINADDIFSYLQIGGRCTSGVEFKAYFEDITLLTELPEKIYSGKNYIDDCYFNNVGELVQDSDYIVCSDFIPVYPGMTILWKSGVANSSIKLACYDKNKAFIDYWSSYKATDNECLLDGETYYVRGSFKKNVDSVYIKDKYDGRILWEKLIGVPSLKASLDIVNEELNYVNYKKGAYFSANGSLVYDGGHFVNSEYIPVKPQTTILWKSGESNTNLNLICYDKNKVFVENFRSYNATDNSVQVPYNAYFVKASFINGVDNVYLKKASDNTILWEKEIGFSYLNDKIDKEVNNVNERIDVLESTSTSNFNKDKIPAIQGAAARPEGAYYADVATQYKNLGLLPVLAVITDAHINASNPDIIKRAFKFVDEQNYVLATLGLGDIADNGTIFKAINWNTLEGEFSKPILMIPGNHESYMGWNAPTPYNAVESDLMDGWYNETLRTRNGETHPVISDVMKSYWYRDFSVTDAKDGVTRTLKVVGLNCYTASENNISDPLGFSQEQLNWFISLLENCTSNTYVVVINHEPISTLLKENRYTEVFNMPSYSIFDEANRSHNVIAEIVNAWKHRQSLNIEYKGNTYTHNFENADGKFACYITGHEHIDGVYKHQTYNDQVEVNLVCTSAEESQQSSDLPRVKGTKTEDCFTLFSFDCYNNRLNLIRVGSDVTTAMKNRKYDNIEIPL